VAKTGLRRSWNLLLLCMPKMLYNAHFLLHLISKIHMSSYLKMYFGTAVNQYALILSEVIALWS